MRRRTAAIALVIAAWGCADPVGPVPVARVAVTPTEAVIIPGESVQLSASVEDEDGNSLSGRDVAWSSSDPAVAAVSVLGVVTGVAGGGPVTVTATSEGKSAGAQITVRIPVPQVKLSGMRLTSPAILVYGSTQTLYYEGTVTNSSGRPVGTGFSADGAQAVLQHWVVQGSARRAAGGAVWNPCYDSGPFGVIPAGTCRFWGGSSGPGPGSAGTGNLVTGNVTLQVEIKLQAGASEIILDTYEFPVYLVMPRPAVATLTVAPATITIAPGGTVQLVATARDTAGSALAGRTVTWLSGNSAVVTVSASGLASAVAAGGPVTITATCEGVQAVARVSVAPPVGSWSAAGELSAPRRDHESVLLPNGKVLVVGGSRSTVELYDAATGSAQVIGSLDAGSGSSATMLRDGRVLILSGHGGATYDPVTGTITPTAGAPSGQRLFHTATRLNDGRVLITGGYVHSATEEYTRADAEIFDPAAGTFTRLPASMTTARHGHAAVLLPDGKVLVAGGSVITRPGYANYVTTAELFDPAAGTFVSLGALLGPAGASYATLLGSGRVLLSGDAAAAVTQLYDPATRTFIPTGTMAQPARISYTVTLLQDGRVLFAGGALIGPVTQASTELYDPATGTFSQAAPMREPRQQASAVLLPDGRVLVLGGWGSDTGTYRSSVEIFSR